MSHTRRKYDPEFRAGAVRIVRETRRPVVEIARDLRCGLCGPGAVDQLQDLLLGPGGHPSRQRTAQPQPTFPRSTASSMAWALTASVN